MWCAVNAREVCVEIEKMTRACMQNFSNGVCKPVTQNSHDSPTALSLSN